MTETRIRYADRLAELDGGDQRPSWAALAEVYADLGAPGNELDIEAAIDRLLDQEQRDGMLSLQRGNRLVLRFPARRITSGGADRIIILHDPTTLTEKDASR